MHSLHINIQKDFFEYHNPGVGPIFSILPSLNNTAIFHSITTLLTVLYIILLRRILAVQPERHNLLFRINYIWFYRKNLLSLSSYLCRGYPISCNQIIKFQYNSPTLPKTRFVALIHPHCF